MQRTQVQEMLEREAARLSYVSEREAVRPPPDRKMPEVEEKDEVGAGLWDLKRAERKGQGASNVFVC